MTLACRPGRWRACTRDGITTVEQLAAKSEGELLALDGIGPASANEIQAKLAELSQPPAAPAASRLRLRPRLSRLRDRTPTVGSDK